MKIPIHLGIFFLVVAAFISCSEKTNSEKITSTHKLQDGDLIFQVSTSGQGRAVQLATHSRFTHCGIIFHEGSETYVYEAVQPVKKTPLNEWIKHGTDNHFEVKRLSNSDKILDEKTIGEMKRLAKSMLGKDYDLTFEWNDDKLYCSEYIFKLYERTTGIEIGRTEKLRDLDLSNDIVKQKLEERYGVNIPLDETVISPGSIFDCTKLVSVLSK